MKAAARSEQLLLETYSVVLPDKDSVLEGLPLDRIANDILTLHHPIILRDVFPVQTGADGNCFYRAMSTALTNSEHYHEHLRLITAIEIMLNNMYYDTSCKKYVDLVKDNRIVTCPFNQLVKETVTLASFSSMTHMYALSAALHEPIRSYYPPQLNVEFVSEPHCRKVIGRNVNKSSECIATIMWSQTILADTFTPNHFVPLLHIKTQPINLINLDDCEEVNSLDETNACKIDGYEDECCKDERDEYSTDVTLEECEQNLSSECVRDESVCEDDENSHPHPLAYGLLDGNFLSLNAVRDVLGNADRSKIQKSIPNGKKENVYFLIEQNNDKRSFSDDCGSWDSSSGSTPKQIFLKNQDGLLKNIYFRKGEYFFQKKIKQKMTYVKLEP